MTAALIFVAVPLAVSGLFGGGLLVACRVRDWRQGGGPR